MLDITKKNILMHNRSYLPFSGFSVDPSFLWGILYFVISIYLLKFSIANPDFILLDSGKQI